MVRLKVSKSFKEFSKVRNILYKHSNESMMNAFKKHGLIVDSKEDIGFVDNGRPLFINYFGYKISEI